MNRSPFKWWYYTSGLLGIEKSSSFFHHYHHSGIPAGKLYLSKFVRGYLKRSPKTISSLFKAPEIVEESPTLQSAEKTKIPYRFTNNDEVHQSNFLTIS